MGTIQFYHLGCEEILTCHNCQFSNPTFAFLFHQRDCMPLREESLVPVRPPLCIPGFSTHLQSREADTHINNRFPLWCSASCVSILLNKLSALMNCVCWPDPNNWNNFRMVLLIGFQGCNFTSWNNTVYSLYTHLLYLIIQFTFNMKLGRL